MRINRSNQGLMARQWAWNQQEQYGDMMGYVNVDRAIYIISYYIYTYIHTLNSIYPGTRRPFKERWFYLDLLKAWTPFFGLAGQPCGNGVLKMLGFCGQCWLHEHFVRFWCNSKTRVVEFTWSIPSSLKTKELNHFELGSLEHVVESFVTLRSAYVRLLTSTFSSWRKRCRHARGPNGKCFSL